MLLFCLSCCFFVCVTAAFFSFLCYSGVSPFLCYSWNLLFLCVTVGCCFFCVTAGTCSFCVLHWDVADQAVSCFSNVSLRIKDLTQGNRNLFRPIQMLIRILVDISKRMKIHTQFMKSKF